MKGRHDTYLIYAHPDGVREVGIVTAVPSKGDAMSLAFEHETIAYVVDEVRWIVGVDTITAFSCTRLTRSRVYRCRGARESLDVAYHRPGHVGSFPGCHGRGWRSRAFGLVNVFLSV